MSLNLRRLTRDHLDQATDLTWQTIALDVLATLDPADRDEALAQALTVFVQDTARKRGIGTMSTGAAQPRALPTPSWKVTQIREQWQRRLEVIYATAGGRKRLGDFDLHDIQFQAELCRQKAEELHLRAVAWEQLANEIATARVSTVRELDQSSVAILDEVAA